MKVLTAFRNTLKRYGDITEITWRPLSETDDIISFKVSFRFKARPKPGETDDFVQKYKAFRAAWNAARRKSDEDPNLREEG